MRKLAFFYLAFFVKAVLGEVEDGVGWANPDEFTFHVQIYKQERFVCSGAILSPFIIITAATCVNEYPAKNITVAAGSPLFIHGHGTSSMSRYFQQIRQVEGYLLHPMFTSTCDFVNSLALIYLKEPFNFNTHVQAISLPRTEDFVDFSNALRIGFGIEPGNCNRNPAYSPDLKKLPVSFDKEEKCKILVRRKWDRKMRKEELCSTANVPYIVGDRTIRICVMEKGTPVICKTDSSHPILCGIVAVTTNKCKCECQSYGITNNLQEYLEWIGDAFQYITFKLKCDKNHIYCPSKHACLPRSVICDGVTDCPLGEDETNCVNLEPCSAKDSFRCPDGKCIGSATLCNRVDDCERKRNDHSGDDEIKCNEYEDDCADGLHECGYQDRCIPAQWKCDGVPDCLDGSDEEDCATEGESQARKFAFPWNETVSKNWMSYASKTRVYNNHGRANKCVETEFQGSYFKLEAYY